MLITETMDALLMEGLTQMGYEWKYAPGISQDEVEQIIHEFNGLIVATRITVSKLLLKKAVRLKFVGRAGSGMENIDLEAANALGIICINSPEGNANSVGEHALALLLASYHNIVKANLELQHLQWNVEENRVQELEGRTVGIIGYGNTGKAFAKKLFPFGVQVMAYDKYLENFSDQYASQCTLQMIFDEAEIVSVHVPLTSETAGMVNSSFLKNFRKNIFMINTSRGKVVKHQDLLQGLQEGRVTGAALDVYENENFETHTASERKVFAALLETGKVICTPHVAGKSFESKGKIAKVLLEKINNIN